MNKLGFIGTTIGLALVGFLLYRFAAKDPPPVVVTLVPGPPQPRVSPGEAGLDPQALEAAVAYAGTRNTHALLVGHGGHVVFEKYWNGITADTPVDPGFAPVLLALAVGSAMNDRLINNLDAPLSNYMADAGEADGAITLRQLMAQDVYDMSPGDSTDLLAQVLERVTSQPYPQLVAERLWRPMGAGSLAFRADESRQRPPGVLAGCCVRARVADWMRLGELLAHDGVFEGNQFTPPRYVSLMLKPAHKDSPRGFFTRVDGEFAAHDVAWLEGTHLQRLWIVPSLRLSILRIGDVPSSSQDWDEAMIPNSIIRGTRGWKPRAAGEGVDPGKFAPH
jgi:CubicO group peptidase (beta-lactamase class C family)